MKKISHMTKKTVAVFFILTGLFVALFAVGFGRTAFAQNDVIDITGGPGSDYVDPGTSLPYNENQGAATTPTNPTTSSGSLQPPKDIPGVFTFIKDLLLNYVVTLIIGIAVVMFLVGVLGYVRAGDNEEKRAQGRDLMLYGIVCLFVMVSVWGFVKLLTTSFFGKDAFNLPTQLPESAKVAPK